MSTLRKDYAKLKSIECIVLDKRYEELLSQPVLLHLHSVNIDDAPDFVRILPVNLALLQNPLLVGIDFFIEIYPCRISSLMSLVVLEV